MSIWWLDICRYFCLLAGFTAWLWVLYLFLHTFAHVVPSAFVDLSLCDLLSRCQQFFAMHKTKLDRQTFPNNNMDCFQIIINYIYSPTSSQASNIRQTFFVCFMKWKHRPALQQACSQSELRRYSRIIVFCLIGFARDNECHRAYLHILQ